MKKSSVRQSPRILVVGCSMTAGHGLKATAEDPLKIDVTDTDLWVNLLCNKTFDYPGVTNLAVSGRNNEWIFLETATDHHPGYKSQVIFANYLSPILSKKTQ